MNQIRSSIRVGALAAMLTLTLGLAACGDSDDGGDQAAGAADNASAKEEKAQVKAAMVTLQDAFYGKDAKTFCAGITDRIAAQLAAANQKKNGTCEDMVKGYVELLNAGGAQGLKAKIMDVKVNGDRASLQARQGERKPYWVPFRKQDGDWKMHAGLAIPAQ